MTAGVSFMRAEVNGRLGTLSMVPAVDGQLVPAPARLFHFCCRHSYERMVQYAVAKDLDRLTVVPGPRDHLVWLTDLRLPSHRACGLTMDTISCDRMEYRLEVAGVAHRWTDWAHEHRIDLEHRLGLDAVPGARPRHWWVSEQPMAVYDVQPMPVGVIP